MKYIANAVLLFGVILLMTVSCSKQNNEDFGTLKVYITDAPFPIEYIDSANVIITKVEARIKGSSSDSGYTVLSEDTLSFNLLDLRNGITAKMVDLEIPAGDIDLIRLYVDKASLVLNNGDSYSVKVPSGSQTGIKVFIDPALTISGGLISELILDFNLEKSFVLKGNMDSPAGIKGFNFKPVIRAVNRSTSGTVSGVVTDTSFVVVPNASVWIEQDTLVGSAMTDSAGYYAISALPAGTYMMSASKESYDTVVVTEVNITAANLTIQDFRLTPKD